MIERVIHGNSSHIYSDMWMVKVWSVPKKTQFLTSNDNFSQKHIFHFSQEDTFLTWSSQMYYGREYYALTQTQTQTQTPHVQSFWIVCHGFYDDFPE